MGSYLFKNYNNDNKEQIISSDTIYPPNHINNNRHSISSYDDNYNNSKYSKNFITRLYEYLICKNQTNYYVNNITIQTSTNYNSCSTNPILNKYVFNIDNNEFISCSYETNDNGHDNYFDVDSVNSEPIMLYSETDSDINFYNENIIDYTSIILKND